MSLINLWSCLVICSRGVSSAETTMVIRDMSFCSVAPTASDSMLNPRRENNAATRASTPGLSSTNTERVCVVVDPAVICAAPSRWHRSCGARSGRRRASGVSFDSVVEERADAASSLDLVVRGAGGHHRPHLRVGADDEVDDNRTVVDRPSLGDQVAHIFPTI